jgi:hypothetical protein
MANFVQGDASPIAEIKPWSPDWSFLEEVYGVTQARYDKGFNQVKNLYNSILNGPLTNSENQDFRNQMFQKIQGSLRNVSAIDLSNPTNVMRAQKLIDPIADDEELAYDMYVTKYHGNQKNIMNNYKNSTDAKVRAQYSDYSKMDIAFAEEDLRKAKRGDGSITSVQPRDFTPFDDVNEYLSAAAKDAKLQVKFSNPDGKGYIMTYTNGKYAEVPFSNWAAMTMGNRFDRQFGVIGRVTAETQIRNLMNEQGMTRQQATSQVSRALAEDYKTSQKEVSQESDKNTVEVDHDIQAIEESYPFGIPPARADVQAKYDKLIAARDELKGTKEQADSEIKKVEEDPENYTVSNLTSILSQQAKKNAATIWGVSTAQATAEVDIKPDQKVIADFDRAAANARHQASLNQAWKIHEDNKQMELYKLEKQEELEIMKLKADGKLPNESYVGSYVGSATTGVDLMSAAGNKNKTELFNNAFGAQTGLINLVIGKNADHSKYYQVLSKVQSIASGSGGKLTESEKGTLKEYGRLVGYQQKMPDLNNASSANSLLSQLAANTYGTATKKMQTYSDIGKSADTRKYMQAFTGTITAMKGIMQEGQQIEKSQREIAGRIYNFRTGQIKPEFAGAKIVSRMADGTPIFDLSKLPEAKKQSLSNVVGAEFTNRSRPVGAIYTMTKPSQAEFFTFFNKNNTIKVTAGGEKIDPTLIGKLPYATQVKLFGESFEASFDPSGKKVIVDLKIDPASAEAKTLKIPGGETVRVEIPYELIKSNTGLQRFNRYANQYDVNSDSYGIMEGFSRNQFARVEAPSVMAATGFDWTAAGVRNANGQYGVNVDFTMLNPEKNKKETTSRFLQVDPNDPAQFMNISEMINDTWTNYQMATDSWDGYNNR